MKNIIFILTIIFSIGFISSFIINRFTKSKLMTLLPTILGIIFLIYNSLTSNPNDSDGLESINILIKEIITSGIIAGNIFGLILISFKKNKDL